MLSTVASGKMGSSKSAFHTGACDFALVSVLYVTAPGEGNEVSVMLPPSAAHFSDSLPAPHASEFIKKRESESLQAFCTPTCDGIAQRLGEENEPVRVRCAHYIHRRKTARFDNSDPVQQT